MKRMTWTILVSLIGSAQALAVIPSKIEAERMEFRCSDRALKLTETVRAAAALSISASRRSLTIEEDSQLRAQIRAITRAKVSCLYSSMQITLGAKSRVDSLHRISGGLEYLEGLRTLADDLSRRGPALIETFGCAEKDESQKNSCFVSAMAGTMGGTILSQEIEYFLTEGRADAEANMDYITLENYSIERLEAVERRFTGSSSEGDIPSDDTSGSTTVR